MGNGSGAFEISEKVVDQKAWDGYLQDRWMSWRAASADDLAFQRQRADERDRLLDVLLGER